MYLLHLLRLDERTEDNVRVGCNEPPTSTIERLPLPSITEEPVDPQERPPGVGCFVYVVVELCGSLITNLEWGGHRRPTPTRDLVLFSLGQSGRHLRFHATA